MSMINQLLYYCLCYLSISGAGEMNNELDYKRRREKNVLCVYIFSPLVSSRSLVTCMSPG